jgi:ribosomal protein L11 methyltransferase
MKPEYLAFTFQMGQHNHDIWLALLGEWPFEAFHEEGDFITGYIQHHDITQDMLRFISDKEGLNYDGFELTEVQDRNWNEVWESSFNPVAVDDYCYIHASFHRDVPASYKHIVKISPKMAFGTGHHATTFMMLQAMSKIVFKDKKVFDFGCGTGILSVVAALEGAARVTGVDIQTEAIENSEEHAMMNGVKEKCQFYLGGIERVEGEMFDIILANINRNVIKENLSSLKNILNPSGDLILSGMISDDMNSIREALAEEGFTIVDSSEKDQWIRISARLNSHSSDQ